MSRDLIGELGGINLYGFVGNDVSNRFDKFGLVGGLGIGGPPWPGTGDATYSPYSEGQKRDTVEWFKAWFSEHYLPQAFIEHYSYGEGAEYEISEEEMGMIDGTIDFMLSYPFQQHVKRLQERGVVELKEVRIGGQVADLVGTLGQHGLIVSGALCGTPESWSFVGTMRFEDDYNFNLRAYDPVNLSERTWRARAQVVVAAFGLPGQGFPVVSPGVTVTQTSEDRYAQWSGNGKGVRISYTPPGPLNGLLTEGFPFAGGLEAKPVTRDGGGW